MSRPMTPQHARPPARPLGFSLVEVLVALLVLSIGVLGLTRLEVFAVRSHSDTLQKAYARFAAETVLERMRANVDSLDEYLTQGATFTYGYGQLIAPVDCRSTACTTEELAAYDRVIFDRLLANLDPSNPTALTTAPAAAGNHFLSEAEATITRPVAGDPDLYAVTIEWEPPDWAVRPSAAADPNQPTMRYRTVTRISLPDN
jgi:type IV pilus modification protein PilV